MSESDGRAGEDPGYDETSARHSAEQTDWAGHGSGAPQYDSPEQYAEAMQRWFEQQQPQQVPGAYPIPPQQPAADSYPPENNPQYEPYASEQQPVDQQAGHPQRPDEHVPAQPPAADPLAGQQGPVVVPAAEHPGHPQQYPSRTDQQYGQQQYAPGPEGQYQTEQAHPAGQYPAQQPGAQPYPEQPQPALPSPEDLLVSGHAQAPLEPASWGWRGKLNRGSGGLIKAKPKPAELEVRDAIKRITRSFSRPMTVVVIQPKGGAGKTPTTVCLSAAFGATRGGYVVGWDDNETRGTLSVRVDNPDKQQATVWDLLSDLPAFERYDARVGDLSYYVRSQPDAHFDALVSDDNPANMAQIGDEAFQRLHTVLQRFYRVIVVDTGNNVRSPNWQAAVNAADLVVAVSTYQRDVGFSASWVLDHLAQTGREELARNAVTVLTAADPTVDKAVREQLVSHFRARTRAVAEIPYDVELAHGGPIRWTHLNTATRNAWIKAGATVVDALADHDNRTLAARRE